MCVYYRMLASNENSERKHARGERDNNKPRTVFNRNVSEHVRFFHNNNKIFSYKFDNDINRENS